MTEALSLLRLMSVKVNVAQGASGRKWMHRVRFRSAR
jgi:hypothetical protein